MNESLERELEALRAEYRASLGPRIARLRALIAEAAGGESAARMSELRRELHTIAGSAKTFGLPAATNAARAAETYLQARAFPEAAPSAAEQVELEALLEQLTQAI